MQLVEAWPRNELDNLPDMLYAYSNLPLNELRSQVAAWPYNRKLDLFEAYAGQRQNRRQQPGPAFQKLHYTWDLVSSYAVYRGLERQHLLSGATRQPLTPRYGYEIPKIAEEAGVSDDFQRCFDLSLEFYSLLQQTNQPEEAQYATLLGHRTRWKLSHNGLEAARLLEQPAEGEAAVLLQRMHAKLAELHPLVAETIQFAPG